MATRRCTFFRKLFLLLWKNVKLKLRSPLTAVELVWPLFLFIVLLILRRIYGPIPQPDTSYRPQALPSAGVLPFVQSLVCDLSNNSINNTYNQNISLEFEGAGINEVYASLYEFIQSNNSWEESCKTFESTLSILNGTDNMTTPDFPEDEIPLVDFLTDPDELRDFLISNWSLSPDIVDTILNSSIKLRSAIDWITGQETSSFLNNPFGSRVLRQTTIPPILPDIFPNVSELNQLVVDGVLQPAVLREVLCQADVLNQIIDVPEGSADGIVNATCRADEEDYYALSQELQHLINYTEIDIVTNELTGQGGPVDIYNQLSQLATVVRQVVALTGGIDGNSSFLCGNEHDGEVPLALIGAAYKILRQALPPAESDHKYEETTDDEEVDVGEEFLDIMKELKDAGDVIRPKILFTPDNSLTWKIIERANRTVAAVYTIRSLTEQLHNCSVFINETLTEQGDQLRRTLFCLLVADRSEEADDRSTEDHTYDMTMDNEVIPVNCSSSSYVLSQVLQSQPESSTYTSLYNFYDLLDMNADDNIWIRLEEVIDVSQSVLDFIDLFDWNIFMPAKDEETIERLSMDYTERQEHNISFVYAGIVFDNLHNADERNASTVPPKVRMRLRLNSTFVHDTTLMRQKVWVPGPEDLDWKKVYLYFWFIYLQDVMERAVLQEILNKTVVTPGVYINEMAYPCYDLDYYMVALELMMPMVMTIAWLFSIAMNVHFIVKEKQLRLKEFMKMMGLSNGVHWTAWFITQFIVISISIVAIVPLLKFGGLYPKSNMLIIWLYLELYAVSLIFYGFLVSVFFTNANVAACLAGLTYYLMQFATITLVSRQNSLEFGYVLLTTLLSPNAFGLGADYVAQYELKGEGIQFYNMDTSPLNDDAFSFSWVMIMLAVDSVIYWILTWYIEEVRPGKYGVSRPFYFFIQPTYWFGQQASTWFRFTGSHPTAYTLISQYSDEEGGLSEVSDSDFSEDTDGNAGSSLNQRCEKDPKHLPLGIAIDRLTKSYPAWPWQKQEPAVKSLSLKFYEGQITALLGHNGAGKTTVMSVLTGLYEPSAGTAYVYNNDIRSKMDAVRESLGLCPQHNVLFENLTVEEHLLFFGQLKGMPYKEAKESVPGWLMKVNLLAFKKMRAKHLSGGMKRKLSILLAFIGESRTVILDEPTSGVDPFARRQIWDFLSTVKDGRTIMLSTHHMDEAEILGDRIAIISKGELITCGSFFYLKQQFGKGHVLTIARQTQRNPLLQRRHSQQHRITVDVHLESESHEKMNESGTPEPEDFIMDMAPDCSVGYHQEQITRCLKLYMPNIKFLDERGPELRYLVPLDQPHLLARLFDQLDSNLGVLRIASYGLSACSMEQVFVALNEERSDVSTDVSSAAGNDPTSVKSSLSSVGAINADSELTVVGSNDVFSSEDEALLIGDSSYDDLLGSEQSRTRVTGFYLLLLQFYALLVKRAQYATKRYLMFAVQNLFPLTVIIVCLGISKLLTSIVNPPPLEFNPDDFFSVNKDNYAIVSGHSKEYTEPFYDAVFQQCGFGPQTDAPESCNSYNEQTSLYSSLDLDQYYDFSCNATEPDAHVSCDCQYTTVNGTTVCEIRPARPMPLHPHCVQLVHKKSTKLQDLRYGSKNSPYDNDVTDVYVYWSRLQYAEERYGGVHFGDERLYIPAEVDEFYDDPASDPMNTLPVLGVKKFAKAWHTYKGYHAMPIYLNSLNNAILRGNLPDDYTNHSQYGIVTISHPFKTTWIQKLRYALERASFMVNPMACMFALSFLTAGFALVIIEEKSDKVKHLQLVCGLNRFIYWLTNYIWDMSTYIVFIGIIVALFKIFNDPNFAGDEVLPVLAILFITYGICTAPWVYLLSFLFKSPTTAYVVLFCINFFLGFAMLIVDFIVFYITGGETLTYTLLILPSPGYCIGRAMLYFSLDRVVIQAITAITGEITPSPLEEVQRFIIAMCIYAAAGWLGVFFIEYIKPRLYKKMSSPPPTSVEEDIDVKEERRRVMADENTENDVLVLKDLTKIFYSNEAGLTNCSCSQIRKQRVAVNRLCVGVHKGECFGLLGVNGAGKTSTFRMLTGDTRVSSGDAYINSHSIRTDMGSVRQTIGYCPQFDALIEPLTGRQHLVLYCRLRGIPQKQMEKVIETALVKLQLKEHADKPVAAYSGGNRRKLSTAIALLARPPVVFLDEPTAGLDPKARRFLWSVIQNIVNAGQSVVLTTHSMAECEALCSRVGIMVNGTFQCLGSPQHLKERFGDGYRIKIRMKEVRGNDAMKEFMRQNFPEATLNEEHFNTMVYQIPSSAVKLAQVFRLVEGVKESLDIEGYSVSQTTLDDVFIHFANQQCDQFELKNNGSQLSLSSGGIELTQLPDIVSENTPLTSPSRPLEDNTDVYFNTPVSTSSVSEQL